MRLKVLSSGSKANGYVLYDNREALVLECGIPYTGCLTALGFDRRKIVGAVVTHEHKDHGRYAFQYANNGIRVFATQGTIEGMKEYSEFRIEPKAVSYMTPFSVGSFRVIAFDTQHDSKEPCGFVISHKDMGNVVFATDTYYLKYKFDGLNQVMLECNYEDGIIEKNVKNGVIPEIVRDRVFRSHMSLSTTARTLASNDLKNVNNIVLVHLSGNNSDSMLFKNTIEGLTGKVVTIAKKGVDIPFDKTF